MGDRGPCPTKSYSLMLLLYYRSLNHFECTIFLIFISCRIKSVSFPSILPSLLIWILKLQIFCHFVYPVRSGIWVRLLTNFWFSYFWYETLLLINALLTEYLVHTLGMPSEISTLLTFMRDSGNGGKKEGKKRRVLFQTSSWWAFPWPWSPLLHHPCVSNQPTPFSLPMTIKGPWNLIHFNLPLNL